MRIVFMGTPDFAVGTLQALVESGKHEIVAVITQPDRPKGRGQKMLMTPVKEYALTQNLPVYQPLKVKTPEFIAELQQMQPEIVVVAAFGQLLNRELLTLPPLGCVNVHASLLPKYRGAAPIHYAVLQGEKESGVTIMQMDIGMDTGDMLSKVTVPIGSEMTMGELHDQLKAEGAKLLVATLDAIADGSAKPEKQNEAEATYAKLLDRSMEKIDWTAPAQQIHDLVRGFNPAPGAFTKLPDGKTLKIWRTVLAQGQAAPAGTVTAITKKGFVVSCGDGALEILEVQPESKKRMEAKVFCNGRGVEPGTVLGNIEG
ncbi:methionyl-tRNA formyltransferase [uncultured Phascolarctobacterium sp.]|uniref:methionyl-tRNA formyltransferase n=1 Tax=uncultured Phascolarctobacterium sp. TaxID=512296 RepID=UPI0027D93DCE|nr:methionyl-tRNA formyltransferase [uncultured Phascolarctobacterium sp.]